MRNTISWILSTVAFGLALTAVMIAWRQLQETRAETCIPFFFTAPMVPRTTEVEVCMHGLPEDFSIFDVSVSPEPNGGWQITGLRTAGGRFTVTERPDLSNKNLNVEPAK